MRRLYTTLLYLLLPILLLRLLIRGFKNPAYWRRWPERFGFIKLVRQPHRVWLHAVSVGESKAAEPLINALLERFPNERIVVTTMTPTGSRQVLNSYGQRVDHCYVPYDYPFAIKRFLAISQPRLVVIMETEIWPNIIHLCKARAIPVAFVNLRLSQKSYARYRWLGRLLAPALAKVDTFAVQSQADLERLLSLGARPEHAKLSGNIKFDISLPVELVELAATMRHNWGNERLVWLAGSTHETEEEQILSVYERIRVDYPQLLLVIVPRHPERFKVVARLCSNAGYDVVRRSDNKGRLSSDTQVYIGDTMGELPVFYAAADIAFVGGSLVPTGGHNVLEACAVGVPVIFGPHMFNFEEIGQLTLERNAGTQVADSEELNIAVRHYLANPDLRALIGANGRNMIAENRGALDRQLRMLEPYLSD